jgi:GNAT superfamily N-acetyltransferase
VKELTRLEMFAAAQWIGDRPHVVLPTHALMSGRCRAWVMHDDSPEEPRALLVRTDLVPSEPVGFGRDPEALTALLLSVDPWRCVNVGDALMQTLPPVLSRKTGRTVRRYDDLYYVLVRAGPDFQSPLVRLLNEDDVDVWKSADDGLAPTDRRLVSLILREGICAAAIVNDRMVARAFAYAITPLHADLSASTAPAFRGRGLISACSSAVIRELQNRRITPVWSTGQDNLVSQHVAHKLGFAPISPRVYLSLHGDSV